MKTVMMIEHDFKKQNLFTQPKGDFYRCSICGCEGWRKTIGDYITVTEEQYTKASKCSFKQPDQPKSKRPERVLLATMPYIGIVEGIHPVVPCPDKYKKQFENDVWVYSESRKEVVRIMPHEIISKE